MVAALRRRPATTIVLNVLVYLRYLYRFGLENRMARLLAIHPNSCQQNIEAFDIDRSRQSHNRWQPVELVSKESPGWLLEQVWT